MDAGLVVGQSEANGQDQFYIDRHSSMLARGESGQQLHNLLRSRGEFFRSFEHKGLAHVSCLIDDEFDDDGTL